MSLSQDTENENNKIIELKPVPLKKVSICPKPTLLHTKDDNYYIIFITDFFSDKKCLVYDIERKYYFDLCEYPDLRFISPIYSISPNGESLYIFDGEHQSFAMLDIDIDINDACHHPKVINIRKTKRKTEKLRNIIKTGKGCLSIYLPSPWNEYHIIGGQTNNKHLKWSSKKKSFVKVSETNSILGKDHNDSIDNKFENKFNNNGICATSIYFSSKFKQFILMGGGINNDFDCIWNLSYPTTESRGFWWLKSLSKLPYKNMSKFGSIMFNQQYIITFGGIAIKTNSTKPQKPKPINDIFILDIERNEWRKSKAICPCFGIFHAIYLPKFKKIHLFNTQRIKKNNNQQFQHWLIDLDYILKQTIPFKRQIFDVDIHETLNAYHDDDNNSNDDDEEIEIKNAEEIDPKQHILYKDKKDKKNKDKNHKISPSPSPLLNINDDIISIRDEISLIWDFITQLKQDMQTIKQYQLEIIQNSSQNSQRIIELHKNIEVNYVKKKDKEKKKKKKREKQLRRAQTVQTVQTTYTEKISDDEPIQSIQSIQTNKKPMFDIFDTDDSDSDNDNDQVEDKQEIVNNVNTVNNANNVNNVNNVNNLNIDNGHTKNLSMMSENVEYDSIEIDDDEQDKKLKARIRKQINNNQEIEKKEEEKEEEKEKLKEWLIKHRLGEYYKIFIEKGYESLDKLRILDDNMLLTQIGVSKLVHRRKLIAKLKQYYISQ